MIVVAIDTLGGSAQSIMGGMATAAGAPILQDTDFCQMLAFNNGVGTLGRTQHGLCDQGSVNLRYFQNSLERRRIPPEILSLLVGCLISAITRLSSIKTASVLVPQHQFPQTVMHHFASLKLLERNIVCVTPKITWSTKASPFRYATWGNMAGLRPVRVCHT